MTTATQARLLEVHIGTHLLGFTREYTAEFFHGKDTPRDKVMKPLLAGGYVTRSTNGKFTLTNKYWDALEAEPVDLSAVWDTMPLKQYHDSDPLPYVLFRAMSPGQQKTIVMNRADYTWFACSDYVTRSNNRINEHNTSPPITGTAETLPELLRNARMAAGIGADLLIQTPAMKKHAEDVLAKLEFDRLYSTNFAWALQELKIAKNYDVEVIRSSKQTNNLFFDGHTNIGNVPAEWPAKLDDRIDALQASIESDMLRLITMKTVRNEIATLGGWDVFHAKYTEALREAVAENAKQTPE